MSARSWLSSSDHVKILAKVQIAAFVLVAAGSAFLAFRAFSLNAQAANAQAAAEANAAEILELRAQLYSTAGVEPPQVPSGLQAVAAFQAALEIAAVERGCEVTEFQAEPTILPYLSRFHKVSDDSEWGQLEIRINLRGTLTGIIATLAAIEEFDIPSEFNGVELSRTVATREGAVLDARVQLRVLSK